MRYYLFNARSDFDGLGLYRDKSKLAKINNSKFKKTRCSAIAERPPCRVRYSFRQKYKTGTGRQYFTDIIGLSLTAVI